MSDTSFIRFISGIFDFVETRIVPAFLRMRIRFRESVRIGQEKLDFSPFPFSLVSRWPAWLQPGTLLHRFLVWFGCFLFDSFVLLSCTAAMLCILYVVW